MIVVQRTHKLRHDRAWLPPWVRRSGWLVSRMTWATGTAAVIGGLIAMPILADPQLVLAAAVGIGVGGQQAGRGVFRRHVARMTRGEIELAEVGKREDGELVVVRGRIEVAAPLAGVLREGSTGVYRRLVFAAGGKWVHEAAVDFALIDDRGNRILVQAAGARWMKRLAELMTYPTIRFLHDDIDPRVRALIERHAQPTIEATESVLTAGTLVAVVGYKTASPDPTGDAMGYRLPPQRATLRSGPDLPLVITTPTDDHDDF